MELTTYVERIRQQLAAAADALGDDVRTAAERLAASLEPALHLVLLDAMSAVADEITRELAPGSVELRLRGGEPEFVVVLPPEEAASSEPGHGVAPPAAPDEDDAPTARINLRLSEALKERVDEAAGRERLSTNAWLVRLVAAAVATQDPGRAHPPGRPGQSYTGWVR